MTDRPVSADRLADLIAEVKAAFPEAVPTNVAAQDRPAYLRGSADAFDWLAGVIRSTRRVDPPRVEALTTRHLNALIDLVSNHARYSDDLAEAGRVLAALRTGNASVLVNPDRFPGEPRFVQVIGPHDTCFVGPFATDADATAFRESEKGRKGRVFDFYVMTETEMRANIAEHGDVPVQTPEDSR